MRNTSVVLVLLATGLIASAFLVAREQSQTNADAIATTPRYATEQEWIVASVVRAIDGMARESASPSVVLVADPSVEGAFAVTLTGAREPVRVVPADHLWAPATYAPVATQLFAADSRDSNDLLVRRALVDLTVDTLLDQNARVSALLQADMRSAAAHEAAALVIGAFALREASLSFDDVRGALSRMAAHLAVASVLRGPASEGLDGAFARAIVTTLAGRQRDALTMLDAIAAKAESKADRAWIRALRLRATGDWRAPLNGVDATLLERLEYARALAERRGSDALLHYLDTEPAADLVDWHRLALARWFNVEIGHRFTANHLQRELAEAGRVRKRLSGDALSPEKLILALNERPAATPFQSVRDRNVVQVLDWGMWAAFAQRHVSHALVARSRHLSNLGRKDGASQVLRESERSLGELTLYPMAARLIADTPGDYERAVERARPVVARTPELVTATVWNALLEKPAFVQRAAAFPLDVPWFTPAVPAGTAFDLDARALRPGCPRPPTRAQAAAWAHQRPYDHWTVWAEAYLALDRGRPTHAAIRRAFGPLIAYDQLAVLKILDYLVLTTAERLAAARSLCEIAPERCDRLGELLLVGNQTAEAAAAYEQWIAKTRDRVAVSNGVTWIVRYYTQQGKHDAAERIARMAADTGSSRGVEVLAELLDRRGEHGQAEALYRDIADRYDNTIPLAGFQMRKALREGNKAGEFAAWALLRADFPNGPQPLAMHALPVRPSDGIVTRTFGRRPEATGLRADDIVVGVDDWRIHTLRQYQIVTRFRHDDAMILTVWRGGRYLQLRMRVPERWFGLQWRDYQSTATTN